MAFISMSMIAGKQEYTMFPQLCLRAWYTAEIEVTYPL